MKVRITSRYPEGLDGLIPTTTPPPDLPWPVWRPYYAEEGFIEVADLAALLQLLSEYGRASAYPPGWTSPTPGPVLRSGPGMGHPEFWTLHFENDYD